MNYKLLAEQNVFAHLIVEKTPPTLTQFQQYIQDENLYKVYNDASLTNVSPDNYSIVNLPDTLYRLPVGSIFEYITLVRSTDPDYRKVAVSNKLSLFETIDNDNNRPNISSRILDVNTIESNQSMEVEEEPVDNLENSIFSMQIPVNNEASRQQNEILQRYNPLYNNLRPILLTKFPNLIQSLNELNERVGVRDPPSTPQEAEQSLLRSAGLDQLGQFDFNTVPLNDVTVMAILIETISREFYQNISSSNASEYIDVIRTSLNDYKDNVRQNIEINRINEIINNDDQEEQQQQQPIVINEPQA